MSYSLLFNLAKTFSLSKQEIKSNFIDNYKFKGFHLLALLNLENQAIDYIEAKYLDYVELENTDISLTFYENILDKNIENRYQYPVLFSNYGYNWLILNSNLVYKHFPDIQETIKRQNKSRKKNKDSIFTASWFK